MHLWVPLVTVSHRLVPSLHKEQMQSFSLNGYYAGRMVVLYSSHQELPFLDFNDKISSVIVTGGTWTVYEHTVYHGHSKTIGQLRLLSSITARERQDQLRYQQLKNTCSTKENSVYQDSR